MGWRDWRDWCLGIGILLMLAAIIILIVLGYDKENTTGLIIVTCLGGVGAVLFRISLTPETNAEREKREKLEREFAERAVSAESAIASDVLNNQS